MGNRRQSNVVARTVLLQQLLGEATCLGLRLRQPRGRPLPTVAVISATTIGATSTCPHLLQEGVTLAEP